MMDAPAVPANVLYKRFEDLKATDRLPSPTGVAMSILQLVDKESTTIAEICRVVQADPALTARLLKVANSAAMARSTNIVHVRDAIPALGLRQIRNIALGFSLVSKFSSGACQAFNYQEFWSGSLATAVAAQAVCGQVDRRITGEAFTCGLLLRIGQLALATIYPSAYSQLLGQCQGPHAVGLPDLERRQFGIDHHQLSVLMLQDWRLPAQMVEAVAHHLNPPATETPHRARTLALALSLATQFAAICLAGPDANADLLHELKVRGERLRISGARLFTLGDVLAREWLEWSTMFKLQAPTAPSFSKLGEKLALAAAQAAGPSGSRAPEGKLVILVVSGQGDNALAQQLAADHHVVLTAQDGREALETVVEEQPQLLITDWTLPEMDGPTLCRTLRQSKMGQKVRIIMLTDQGGEEGEEQGMQAIAAGADDFLVKPIRARLLDARLRSMQRLIQFGAEIEREREENRRIAADLAVANRKLQEAAYTDVLTGLPNRRYGMGKLETEWNVPGLQAPLACLLLDVDHFKSINDTYGHDAGDVVLKQIAAVLRSQTRGGETMCRWGGEEFLLLCPATDEAGAECAAQRLRTAVEAHQVEFGGLTVKVTVSVGVAVRAPEMKQPDDLLKLADRGVYTAKRTGRNRVCLGRKNYPPILQGKELATAVAAAAN